MNTFKELVNSDTPVLVDFFATWCGPCKMMHPILEQVKSDLGDKVRIVKIDIDKNPQAASQLQIQSVPTLVLFKKGAIQWRNSGVVPKEQLKSVIANYQ